MAMGESETPPLKCILTCMIRIQILCILKSEAFLFSFLPLFLFRVQSKSGDL